MLNFEYLIEEERFLIINILSERIKRRMIAIQIL